MLRRLVNDALHDVDRNLFEMGLGFSHGTGAFHSSTVAGLTWYGLYLLAYETRRLARLQDQRYDRKAFPSRNPSEPASSELRYPV